MMRVTKKPCAKTDVEDRNARRSFGSAERSVFKRMLPIVALGMFSVGLAGSLFVSCKGNNERNEHKGKAQYQHTTAAVDMYNKKGWVGVDSLQVTSIPMGSGFSYTLEIFKDNRPVCTVNISSDCVFLLADEKSRPQGLEPSLQLIIEKNNGDAGVFRVRDSQDNLVFSMHVNII